MVSPARASFLKKSAAVLAASASAAEEYLDATPYELLRAVLGNCLNELRNIQSTEEKIARKRVMLPDFMPWVNGVLEGAAEAEAAGTPYDAAEDDILSQVLVWALDVGDFDKGLELAAHVLRYGLKLPERFRRTPATMIAEEIAEAANKANGAGAHFELETLQRVDELTAREDMPDQVRAKLKKAIGLELALRAAELEEKSPDGPAGGKRAVLEAARDALRRAIELNPRVGVKKDLERIERELKRADAEKE